jgi:hypothetical protein
MSTTTQFDIERLKSIKLVSRHGKFPITRDKRTDVMAKVRSEAIRVLDRGRDVGGIKGRQVHSSRFNEDEWVNSLIALRISEIPKKTQKDKMVREVNRLRHHHVPDMVWQGILLMETAYEMYAGSFSRDCLDRASADYWEMVGLA